MKKTSQFSFLCLALAFLAMGSLNVAHASHGVRDEAGLFSAAAIKQAEQTISQIHNQFGKDILVETFSRVPEARRADYERDRESFFNSFLQERAREGKVDGVYMLVLKESPPHSLRVQVGAGRSTREQFFHRDDQDEVVKLARAALHSGEHDHALRDSISAIEEAFRRNVGRGLAVAPISRHGVVANNRTDGSHGNPILSFLLWGGLIVVAILVVSSLFRRISGGMGGGAMPGAGGGGFMSSLFGGIAGAMAGSWLYDRFFGEHNSSASSWASTDSSGSDSGSDFASSGADVDDSSSGGDSDFGSSGGDEGGGFGDFGGGDSGGSDV